MFADAVYAQPIISKARPDLLKSHFIPTLEKLKKKAVKTVQEEEQLKADTKGDTQEAELLILDEFAVLCRDLYAFYPMLIRYVDNNRYLGELGLPIHRMEMVVLGWVIGEVGRSQHPPSVTPPPPNKVPGEGPLDSALLGQLFCMVSAEATPSSSHATVGQRELVKQGLQ